MCNAKSNLDLEIRENVEINKYCRLLCPGLNVRMFGCGKSGLKHVPLLFIRIKNLPVSTINKEHFVVCQVHRSTAYKS